jgi:hypothetical protein
VGNDEDRDRSRRPGAEDRGWSSTGQIVGGWMIGRSSDVVYGLHHAQGDKSSSFLVEPQNRGRRVSQFRP